MSAAGLIILILFVIALLVGIYYAMICFDKPEKQKPKMYKLDEGPLLHYENDLNGNQDVTITVDRLDQPDAHDSDESSSDEELPTPSAPTEKVTLISIEPDDPAEKILPERKQASAAGENTVTINQVPVPKGDEEDGLVLASPTPAVISATPKKHVRFGSDINSATEDPIDPSSDVEDNSSPQSVPTPSRPVISDIDALRSRWLEANKENNFQNDVNEENKPKIIESQYGKDSKVLHNPTDDIKVKILVPSDSSPSSTEELRSPSDTDTSEPEVTEYSFEIGPLVPSTSTILANEISHCAEPEVTGIKPLSGSAQHINFSDAKTVSDLKNSIENCKQIETRSDSSSGEETPTVISTSSFTDDTYNTAPTTADHSYNTPPKTPPEGLPEFALIEDSSMSKNRDQRSPTFIVVNTQRKNSTSSNSSLSSDDFSPNSSKYPPTNIRKLPVKK